MSRHATAQTVTRGDVILTWLGWFTVARIERFSGYGKGADFVRFSVEEVGTRFDMTLSKPVSVQEEQPS